MKKQEIKTAPQSGSNEETLRSVTVKIPSEQLKHLKIHGIEVDKTVAEIVRGLLDQFMGELNGSNSTAPSKMDSSVPLSA